MTIGENMHFYIVILTTDVSPVQVKKIVCVFDIKK